MNLFSRRSKLWMVEFFSKAAQRSSASISSSLFFARDKDFNDLFLANADANSGTDIFGACQTFWYPMLRCSRYSDSRIKEEMFVKSRRLLKDKSSSFTAGKFFREDKSPSRSSSEMFIDRSRKEWRLAFDPTPRERQLVSSRRLLLRSSSFNEELLAKPFERALI